MIVFDAGTYATCPVCRTPEAMYRDDSTGALYVDLFCDCSYRDVIAALEEPAPVDKGSDDSDAPKKSMGAFLMEFAQEHYRFGRSTEGLLFAVSKDKGAARIATEISALRGPLSARLWEDRQTVVGRDSLSNALEVLKGLAQTQDAESVAIRSAVRGDTVFLDLGDSSGRVVRVTASGWHVEDPQDDHPLFRRSAATMPLPEPERGGSRDDLRRQLHMDEGDQRWLLAYGWLVSSLFEDVSRPLLWASGPQGSGKSTAARMLVNVVDPRDSLGGQPGRNLRDDTTALKARYLASWDNLSAVSQAVSDWFCRIVTGGASEERELFSNDGFRALNIQRSGVATSLYLPSGLRPDAVERIVHVQFERMPGTERASESVLWADYAKAQPKILGALLDDVAGVLRYRDQAAAERRDRPRMADHANILAALDRHRGDDGEAFRSAYCGNVSGALADKALDDPFSLAVLQVVAASDGKWTGTAKVLMREVADAYRRDTPDGPDTRLPTWWPTSPRAVTQQLSTASETLRNAGVEIRRDLPKTKAGKPISLVALRDLDVDVPAPLARENTPGLGIA